MTWWENLEKLRAKPEKTRQRVAFWSALGITLLLALIWFANWRLVMGINPKHQTAQTVSAVVLEGQSAPGWWSETKNRIIRGWKIITAK